MLSSRQPILVMGIHVFIGVVVRQHVCVCVCVCVYVYACKCVCVPGSNERVRY